MPSGIIVNRPLKLLYPLETDVPENDEPVTGSLGNDDQKEQPIKKSAVKIISEENFEIATETELRIMKNESKSKRLAGISA